METIASTSGTACVVKKLECGRRILLWQNTTLTDHSARTPAHVTIGFSL